MKYLLSTVAATLAVTFLLPILATAATLPRATLQIPTSQCVSGAPQITIKWSVPTGAVSYSVFRNKSATSWVNISSKQLATTLTDKNVSSGATYQYQVKAYFTSGASYSNLVSIAVPACTSPAPSPTPPPTNQATISAYITGYGWPDNTPASAEISNPVIHQSAGGTGTYSDPITIAVGHSIINGKDVLDYSQGTKFYIPALRRYFTVEDTCGDGSAPQNGPCHTGYQGHVWLDAWVGGNGANSSSVLSCEDAITGLHTVIENPASNYTVTSGPIFGTSCASLFGDVTVTI